MGIKSALTRRPCSTYLKIARLYGELRFLEDEATGGDQPVPLSYWHASIREAGKPAQDACLPWLENLSCRLTVFFSLSLVSAIGHHGLRRLAALRLSTSAFG